LATISHHNGVFKLAEALLQITPAAFHTGWNVSYGYQ